MEYDACGYTWPDQPLGRVCIRTARIIRTGRKYELA